MLYIITQERLITHPTALAIRTRVKDHIRLLKAINSIAIKGATLLRGVASSNIMLGSHRLSHSITMGSSHNRNIIMDNNHSLVVTHHLHPGHTVGEAADIAEEVVVDIAAAAAIAAAAVAAVTVAAAADMEEGAKTKQSIEKIYS
jgi:hypothetical protein